MKNGAQWFADQGKNGCKGLRSYSVSGRVKKPGVKLVPAGTTARELIEAHSGGMADGHSFKGYLPGGPSGGILPEDMADIPLDFGQLEKHGSFVGSHAVVILSDKDDMKDVALNLLKFFEDESCGQCTPCRNGTEKAVQLMRQPNWDTDLLEDLSTVMADASICGFVEGSQPDTIFIKYFPETEMKDPLFRVERRSSKPEFGETIWQVADRLGIEIPHLCRAGENYRADVTAACRSRLKENVLTASRLHPDARHEGADSENGLKSRDMVFELLIADQPERATSHDPDSKFWNWVDQMEIEDVSRFPAADRPVADRTHAAIAVNLDACINCNLCVRACREVQVNDVIGMAYRGHGSKVIFDFDDGMGASTCVACGECVQACPTGALMNATLLDDQGKRTEYADRVVNTLCPYCGSAADPRSCEG